MTKNSPTVAPDNRQQQDDANNPSKEFFDREFNDIVSHSDEDNERKNLKKLEENPSEGESEKTVEAASTEKKIFSENISYNPLGGSKLKGKTNRQQKTVAGAVLGAIVALVGFSLLSPWGAFLHLKEISMDWSGREGRVKLSNRSARVYEKRLFSNPDNCGAAVRCRIIPGVSQKEVSRLQKSGFTVETTPTGKGGRVRVTALVMQDGTRITQSQFREFYKTDPAFRNSFNKYANTTAIMWRGKATLNKLVTRLKVNRKDPVGDGKTQEDATKSFRRTIYDSDSESKTNIRSAIGDEDINEQADTIIEDMGEDLEKGLDPSNIPDPDALSGELNEAKVGDIIAAGLKGGVGSAALGALGPYDFVCSKSILMKKVITLSRIYKARALIRYAAAVMTVADAAKAGKITQYHASLIGNILTKKSTKESSMGKTFADAPGWTLMSQGKIGNKAGIARFTNAPPAIAAISEAKNTIDRVTLGTCAAQQSFLGQGLTAIIGVGSNFVPGINVASQLTRIAIQAGLGAVMSAIFAYVLPTLVQLASGTIAPDPETDPEGGYGAANAIGAGMGAMGSEVGKATGMKPLTKHELNQNSSVSTSEDSVMKAAETIENNWSNLSFDNPYSLRTRLAIALAPVTASAYSGNPFQSFVNLMDLYKSTAGSTASLAFSSAGATHGPAHYAYGGDQCKDEELNKLELALDAFCNPIYGEIENVVEGSQYDSVAVVDYMLTPRCFLDEVPIAGSGFVTEEGQANPQSCPDFHEDAEGDNQLYAKYMDECVNNEESIVDRSDCLRTDPYFRNFNKDLAIVSGIEDSIEGTLGKQNPTMAGGTNGGGGSASLPDGNKQALAKQILDSGKVTGDSRYMQQIEDISNGNFSCNVNIRILQILVAMSEKYSFGISSLNRFCTGVLTASGTGSLHYTQNGGHAFDINILNGDARVTGGRSQDVQFLRDMLPLLPKGSEIGQRNCRSGENVLVTPGISQVTDTCNHIHVGVPPQ